MNDAPQVPDDAFEELRRALREERARATPPGDALFRHLFVPAFLLFTLLPWMSGGHFVSVPAAGMTAMTIFGAMLIAWMAEQLYPQNREWNVRPLSDGTSGLRRLGRDLFYLLGITQATGWLITKAEPYVNALLEHLGATALHSLWPEHAPFAVRVALAFFAVELCAYWTHRSAHKIALLWQFHSTHHGITELNALKAVRTHPVENLLFHVARTVPLLLLGAGAGELNAAIYFGAVLGILAHANIRASEGVLGWLINFPRYHRVHHSADIAESQSNFGCHTVLWDRIFGTFNAGESSPAEIGIHPVGPRTLWQELAWPFYRSMTTSAVEQAPVTATRHSG